MGAEEPPNVLHVGRAVQARLVDPVAAPDDPYDLCTLSSRRKAHGVVRRERRSERIVGSDDQDGVTRARVSVEASVEPSIAPSSTPISSR